MNTRHVHADVAIGFAEGKKIQFKSATSNWSDWEPKSFPSFNDLTFEWRIKPDEPVKNDYEQILTNLDMKLSEISEKLETQNKNVEAITSSLRQIHGKLEENLDGVVKWLWAKPEFTNNKE